MKKKINDNLLLLLLSVSIGTLLSVVFVDFLPEAIEAASGVLTLKLAMFILLGFMFMLIIEKFIHHEHGHACDTKHHKAHGHAYALAPINLIGEAIHNFIDGLVIAGAYAVNISLGIAATISIIFHELPQEMADIGVLLYSGMSRKKALWYNFLSGLAAVLGAVVGVLFLTKINGFERFIIPFAAGNFLYIAASNLVPQLHRKCGIKDTLLHLFGISLGIGIIVLVTLYGPIHVH
jgi:zinc and cadmium transporter